MKTAHCSAERSCQSYPSNRIGRGRPLEFLEPGVNGYKFTRGDVDDLERVMLQIINSKENMRKLSEATNYPKTSMSMTEEVLKVYSSVLKGKPA